jgi:hypothetical protein
MECEFLSFSMLAKYEIFILDKKTFDIFNIQSLPKASLLPLSIIDINYNATHINLDTPPVFADGYEESSDDEDEDYEESSDDDDYVYGDSSDEDEYDDEDEFTGGRLLSCSDGYKFITINRSDTLEWVHYTFGLNNVSWVNFYSYFLKDALDTEERDQTISSRKEKDKIEKFRQELINSNKFGKLVEFLDAIEKRNIQFNKLNQVSESELN